MGLNVEDIIAELDPAERRKVEEMAAELIAEEMTLRELRKARQLTQVSVARELGINQDAVSRLEQRSDLLLSTLRRTVEAMREPLAHRPVPRPPSGRDCGHRRARIPRLAPETILMPSARAALRLESRRPSRSRRRGAPSPPSPAGRAHGRSRRARDSPGRAPCGWSSPWPGTRRRRPASAPPRRRRSRANAPPAAVAPAARLRGVVEEAWSLSVRAQTFRGRGDEILCSRQ